MPKQFSEHLSDAVAHSTSVHLDAPGFAFPVPAGFVVHEPPPSPGSVSGIEQLALVRPEAGNPLEGEFQYEIALVPTGYVFPEPYRVSHDDSTPEPLIGLSGARQHHARDLSACARYTDRIRSTTVGSHDAVIIPLASSDVHFVQHAYVALSDGRLLRITTTGPFAAEAQPEQERALDALLNQLVLAD